MDEHEQWLALRRQGLGGSDMAAVVGLHPYKTPLAVYWDKLGYPRPARTTTAMALGTALEPVLEALYCLVYGRLTGPAHPGLLVHAEEPWRRGTPDGVFPDAAHGVDYKYTGRYSAHRWGQPGTDEVPVEYLTQAHWYMGLTGARTWDLAVLVGGEAELAVWALRALATGLTTEDLRALRRQVDFRIYCCSYDAELVALLVGEGRRFWQDHVARRTPPPLETAADARAYVRARYPQVLAPVRPATGEEAAWVEAYTAAATEEKAWQAERQRLELLLKEAIGPAEGLAANGQHALWSAVTGQTEVDWQAVAVAAGASPALIAAHTTRRPDGRRFYVSARKG
jgi:putative phage-type endonuclease